MILRKIEKNEIDLLRDFLYEAIFIPKGVDPPPKDIIDQPELRLYYECFGSGKADNASGCYECEPAECRKGLYAEKIKPRAFAEFARRYGV